jgi:hypothetical protein
MGEWLKLNFIEMMIVIDLAIWFEVTIDDLNSILSNR